MHRWAVCFHPRRVIREIVADDSGRGTVRIALAVGLLWGEASLLLSSGPLTWRGAFLSLSFSGLLGVLSLYLSGWGLSWVGSWFGGKANARRVRAAIAWPGILSIVGLAGWIGVLIPLRVMGFGQVGLPADGRQIFGTILLLIAFLFLAVTQLWQILVTSRTLGEVHGFSARRGFATLMMGGGGVLIPILILAGVATIAVPMVSEGHLYAREQVAVITLDMLQSGLERYYADHKRYPATDQWSELTQLPPKPDQPPLSLEEDMRQADWMIGYVPDPFTGRSRLNKFVLNGYAYTYASGGEKTFTLWATPDPFIPESLSFFLDNSGEIRHCVNESRRALPAGVADATLDDEPGLCGQDEPNDDDKTAKDASG